MFTASVRWISRYGQQIFVPGFWCWRLWDWGGIYHTGTETSQKIYEVRASCLWKTCSVKSYLVILHHVLFTSLQLSWETELQEERHDAADGAKSNNAEEQEAQWAEQGPVEEGQWGVRLSWLYFSRDHSIFPPIPSTTLGCLTFNLCTFYNLWKKMSTNNFIS